MADWIPRNEEAFNNLAKQFGQAISPDPVPWGLSAADATALAAALSAWTAAYDASKAADTAARAATQAKAAAREAMERVMRPDAARIQGNPAVTNAMRETAGLAVRKTSRTPVPRITTAPVLAIDAGTRLKQILSWRDAASPLAKKRPAGAVGLALHMKIGGPPPAGIEECRALGLITRSPHAKGFEPEDGGKVVYYIGRWVNTTGDHGPLSAVASAMIAAQT